MTDQRIMNSIETSPVAATLARVDGRWVLTMQRDLAYPPERVWRMLTDPDRLALWSPIVPDRPLTSPGPAVARENPGMPSVDAEVLVADPPRELVHRWDTHLLRWRLEPTATGTRLTLADTLDEFADGSRNGAGWHICLAALAVNLDDDGTGRVVGMDAMAYGWEKLNDAYAAAFVGADS
ncbi:MAG TPA: SRPBCC family protein [Micromonosporaceae bacterium]|jgi:uncharacterized protein YndB with AHSA1/START domain